jgi:cell wall-associated NlpC family hydrolase
MTVADHWAEKLIGLPWKAGGRGPHEFDCWGLLVHVYREQFGVLLPDYPIDPGNRIEVIGAVEVALFRGDAQLLAKPEHGCGVLMGVNSQKTHHVGIWLDVDGGKILHADKPRVRFMSIGEIRSVGYRHISFYRYHTWPQKSN